MSESCRACAQSWGWRRDQFISSSNEGSKIEDNFYFEAHKNEAYKFTVWLSWMRWPRWSGCRHVHSALDSFSCRIYASCTSILCVQFWNLGHSLSGVLSFFVQRRTSKILISDDYVKVTTTGSLIINLPVYVKVITQMKCISCIVFLCLEKWFQCSPLASTWIISEPSKWIGAD